MILQRKEGDAREERAAVGMSLSDSLNSSCGPPLPQNQGRPNMNGHYVGISDPRKRWAHLVCPFCRCRGIKVTEDGTSRKCTFCQTIMPAEFP